MKKTRLFLLLLIYGICIAPAVFTQEAPVYTDRMFNDYINLETLIIDQIETGTIDRESISEIEAMMLKAEDQYRNDIQSRLTMLKFAAENEISNKEAEAGAEQVLADLRADAKKRRAAAASKKIGRTWTGISIGTAIASGSIFAVSALMSADYYYKYTETESADQGAFYLFWWQVLDGVSFVSAITTAVSAAAAGLLTAIF